MTAQRLRDAAKVLRERADAVRRPFSQQERLQCALADWLDYEADSPLGWSDHATTVAELILGGVE